MSIGNLNMQEMYRIHIVLKNIENTQGNAFIMILNRSNMCHFLYFFSRIHKCMKLQNHTCMNTVEGM